MIRARLSIVAALVLGACSARQPADPVAAVDRNAGMAEARAAVAATDEEVLQNRVRALEAEVAEMKNAPAVANMQLLDTRVKALEAKVYADPDPAAAATPAAAPGTRAAPKAVVNPFPTYRRPTQAERDATARLVR